MPFSFLWWQGCRLTLFVLFWQVKLTWQERIYDATVTNGSQSSTSRRDGVELCGDRFVSHVPPFQWQKLLAAVREGNFEKLLETVPAVQVGNSACVLDCRSCWCWCCVLDVVACGFFFFFLFFSVYWIPG